MTGFQANSLRHLLVCGLIGLLGMGQALASPPEDVPVAFPGAILFPSVKDHRFAFDPVAGVLAVTGLVDRHLSLYDPDQLALGAQAAPRKVPTIGDTVEVMYRRLGSQSVFVVSTQSPPGLVLLQSDGTLIHRYRLPEVPLKLYASHNPDDPNVYWERLHHRTQFNLLALKAVDLGETDEGSLLGVSADGKSFLEWEQRGGTFRLRPIQGQRNRRSSNSDNGLPFEQAIFVDTLETGMVASGHVTYSTDLKSETGTYDFAPQQEFPQAPFVAGFFQNQLRVASVNSHQTVAELKLPSEWFQAIKIHSYDSPVIPRVFVDVRRQRLIAATPRAVLPVSLDTLKLPSEPDLKPLAAFPQQIDLGESLEFEITWAGAGPESVELHEPPMGMTLTGRTVRWTPTPEQTGTHKLEVIAKSGGQARALPWIVQCSFPTLALPFLAEGMNIDPAGTHAVVWGDSVTGGARKVAWVDFESKAIVEKEFVDKPFVSALLEGNNLYLCRLDSVEQIQLPGWESVKSESYRLHQPPADITLIPGRRIMVDQVRIDLPELKLAPEITSDIRDFDGWMTGRTGFGDMIDGVLMKPDRSGPRMLVFPAILYRYPARNLNFSVGNGDLAAVPRFDSWYPCLVGNHRYLDGFKRRNHREQRSLERPLDFQIERPREGQSISLQASDSQTGKVVDAIPLPGLEIEEGLIQLFCHDDRFHLLQRQRVVSGSLARWNSHALPFHLEPTQTVFFLNSNEKTSVKYIATGAQEFRFRIISQNGKPVELKSKNGEFEIPSMRADELAETAAFHTIGAHQEIADNEDRLKRYLATIEPWYQAMFGRGLDDKFPVPIPVLVTADHPEQGASVLIHTYIAELPRSAVLQMLNKKRPPDQ